MDQNQSFQTFSFRGTSTSRDAPNPLRPYYNPPSIGLPPSDQPTTSSSSANRSSFPAAARELFSDIDYESYIPDRAGSGRAGDDGYGSGIADLTKRIVDQAIWNYTSVLLAQPFEVAKIVLQCYQADARGAASMGMSTGSQRTGTPSGSVRNGFAGQGGESGVCLFLLLYEGMVCGEC